MEDGDVIDEEYGEGEEKPGRSEGRSQPRQTTDSKKKKPCNQRIDELSTPYKRVFLSTWNDHAYHLPKDKIKNLKLILQKLYAMTPEETAMYFAELRAQAKAAQMRRKLKQKLRKYLLDKHHQKQKARAYKLFKRILNAGISYAVKNPVPPLMSVRLRYLSDIILEQLCDLRKVCVPNRANTDQLGNLLIATADWMAIAVERLYYAAQISINELTADHDEGEFPEQYGDMGAPLASSSPMRLNAVDDPKTYEDMGAPLASSSPMRLNAVDDPKTYKDMGPPLAASSPHKISQGGSHLSQPLASSTPERLSLNETDKETTLDETTYPYYSRIDESLVASTPKSNKAKTVLPIPAYSFIAHNNKTFNDTIFDTSRLKFPPSRKDLQSTLIEKSGRSGQVKKISRLTSSSDTTRRKKV